MPAVRRRVTVLLASGIACAAIALTVPLFALGACTGRRLLTCQEKHQVLADTIIWTNAYVLDFELFETKTSLPLANRALRSFWTFEASTAAARSELEFELGSQLADGNFEQVAPPLALSAPSVKPTGVVTRGIARDLSRLMLAEQQEVLNLEALDTAMNRATYASYSASRVDWSRWQLAAAAGFAHHAEAAAGRVISAQRLVTRDLVAKKLLYGVGIVDLRLAQSHVKHHGLAPSLVAAMRRLGLIPAAITQLSAGFVHLKGKAASFSLTKLISSPFVISDEQSLITALRHFMARTPRAGRPPS
jgi:hypothetical protein